MIKTKEQLQSLIWKLVPKMGLAHWDIGVFFEEQPLDNTELVAECRSLFKYKNANIIFFPRFWDSSEKEKVAVCIHELLHVHTSFYQNGTEIVDGDPAISRNISAIIRNNIIFTEEDSVSAMTSAFHKLLTENAQLKHNQKCLKNKKREGVVQLSFSLLIFS